MKNEAKHMEAGEHVYTSGQFAARANVTLRMLRYYDKMDLLKPSMHRATGRGFIPMPTFCVCSRSFY